MLSKLQYISQGQTPREHLNHIQEILDAGVTLIQLRLKDTTFEIYKDIAVQVKELCVSYKAALIINDQPEVAQQVCANALHLGLNDMAVPDARQIVGNMLIGGTANTIEDIRQRHQEKVSYIGLGPFRFTTTKEKLSPVLGLEGYQKIIHQMKHESIHIPVYAIGGIELNDIAPIIQTGVYGVAVSGLLTHSKNKSSLVKQINDILYHA